MSFMIILYSHKMHNIKEIVKRMFKDRIKIRVKAIFITVVFVEMSFFLARVISHLQIIFLICFVNVKIFEIFMKELSSMAPNPIHIS